MAVRKIETEISLTGEKAFNDGMKSINSNLKTLRSDMAAVSAQFEDNAGSVDALAAKNKILQESVDQQRYKVEALAQMYQKVAAAYGENSAAADKYKQQLNFATAALAKEENALRENEAALKAVKEAAEAAGDATKKNFGKGFGGVVDRLDYAGDLIFKVTDNKIEFMQNAAQKATTVLGVMGKGLAAGARGAWELTKGAAEAAAAVGAVAVAAGTGAVVALVNFAKEAAEAAKAAAEAGEELSESQQKWLAYSDTLGNLDSAVGNAKQALGGILLPQLSKLSEDGTKYLNEFAASLEAAGDDSKKQSEVISEYMVKGVNLLKGKVPEYVQIGGDWLRGLKEGFAEVAPELMDEGIDLVFDLAEGLIENASAMGPGGDALFETLKTKLEGRGPELVYSAASLVSRLATGAVEHAPELIPIAGELIKVLVLGLVSSLPELGTAAGQLIAYLAQTLADPGFWGDLLSAGWEIGKAIAEAIWNGLVEIWNGISDIPGLVEGLNNFGSTVGIGPIPGYAHGLDRVPYDNYLARLHRNEMVLTAAEAERYRRGAGSGRNGATVNLTINAKQLTREDMEMVVDLVNRKLGDDL